VLHRARKKYQAIQYRFNRNIGYYSNLINHRCIGWSGSDGGSATKDSVYLINPCEKGTHRDPVEPSSLSAAIQTYLSTNYSGFTFTKAFAVKDTTGTVKGYVVIINFNGKPVGLEFKADGTFVKVLGAA
jgi:hypothetical protein